MLNDIWLGLKDIWNEKWLALCYILFFLNMMFIVVSTTDSLYREKMEIEQQKAQDYKKFQTYVIGMQPEQPEEFLKNLSDIYQKNAFSYCHVQLQAKTIGALDTYIVFGDVPKKLFEKKPEKNVSILVGSGLAQIREITVNGKKYKVDSVIKSDTEFTTLDNATEFTDNKVFIIISEPQILEWVSPENYDVMYQLVKNTQILSKDKERETQFLRNVNTGFLDVKKEKPKDTEEIGFILKFIDPFLVIILLSCMLCTALILNGMIKKRIREFSLHLIHGALLTDIFMRVVTFFVVILLISTGIGIFLGIIQLEELWFYALLETGIILIFAGILTPKLKRQNYSLNLRDGGVI